MQAVSLGTAGRSCGRNWPGNCVESRPGCTPENYGQNHGGDDEDNSEANHGQSNRR